MIERNELDVLENAEQSVIDRLTAEYPPRDEKEKEKVFSMSERKFKYRSNQTEKTAEQTVSGVEVYKRPKWQKFLSIAAAAVLIVGGLGGGAYAYRQFSNGGSAVTDTSKKTAPFGDFAELEYQLCHYNSEPKTIYIDNETDEEGKVYFYRGMDITQEQREQIAGFLNNYDYEEISDADVLLSAINQSLKEADNEEAASDDFKNAPSFVYESGNEIRSIDIQELDGTGILRYSCCKYTDEDGRLVAAAQDYSINTWKIDYDLFKSTIEGILGTETKQPTTEAIEETVPFDDFFGREITVSSDYHTNISVTTDGDYLAYVSKGKEIPSEKREQIGELFNSLELKKKDRDPFIEDMPFQFQSLDKLDFVYLNGDELAYITLHRDSNILVYDSFHVETINNGSNIGDYYYYRCTDEGHARDDIKIYDIDYDEIAGRIREILGDEFASETAMKNNYAGFNWKVKGDTDIYLSDNDKEALYGILNSCKWEMESMNEYFSDIDDSNASDSVILYSEDSKMHQYVSLQTLPEYTLVEFCEYNKNEAGEIIPSKSGEVYKAYDTELVKKIKAYLSGEDTEDGVISFSFLKDGNWGCRINNEDAPYSQIDLYEKVKNQYGEVSDEVFQFVYYTNYLSFDKIMKITALLESKEWEIFTFDTDPSEQNGSAAFTTRTVDNFIEMRVQSGDEKTTINFDVYGYELNDMGPSRNEDGTYRFNYNLVDKEVPYYFLSKSLWFSCDDPNLAQEIADIIAE
ncbi:hypothetical protein [Ruminococcus flavefaciens]|uniref:hypothetical protein n=1 Tax=Ruminococcus flavefaciens TaxID=1265 RepID=UPI00048F4AE5|nr:hypothetical protein [Ruminococcus flavefaciens]